MDITKTYGIKVFSDAVMSQRLPRDVYESLKLTQRMGTELDSTIAGAVAAACVIGLWKTAPPTILIGSSL